MLPDDEIAILELSAAKPTSGFDARWGKEMFAPDAFAAIVYDTL